MKVLLSVLLVVVSMSVCANPFVCPEKLNNEEDQTNDLRNFLKSMINQHPDWTIEDVMNYRTQLLIENNCIETLKNINRFESDRTREINR